MPTASFDKPRPEPMEGSHALVSLWFTGLACATALITPNLLQRNTVMLWCDRLSNVKVVCDVCFELIDCLAFYAAVSICSVTCIWRRFLSRLQKLLVHLSCHQPVSRYANPAILNVKEGIHSYYFKLFKLLKLQGRKGHSFPSGLRNSAYFGSIY